MPGGDIVTLWEFPWLSQDCVEGPRIEQLVLSRDEPSTVILHYDYETESGEYAWAAVKFCEVIAFKFTDYFSCTVDQLDALDEIAEVRNSKWLKKLLKVRREETPPVHHYRMFFDETGCYDIAAERFEPPTV